MPVAGTHKAVPGAPLGPRQQWRRGPTAARTAPRPPAPGRVARADAVGKCSGLNPDLKTALLPQCSKFGRRAMPTNGWKHEEIIIILLIIMTIIKNPLQT